MGVYPPHTPCLPNINGSKCASTPVSLPNVESVSTNITPEAEKSPACTYRGSRYKFSGWQMLPNLKDAHFEVPGMNSVDDQFYQF